MPDMIKHINYNGFDLISADCNTIRQMIISSVYLPEKTVFIHVNHFNYYKLLSNFTLNRDIAKTKFIFEGIAMKVSACILGFGWNKDVNGTDLFPMIADNATNENLSIFVLGSKEEINAKAIDNIHKSWPELRISGSHHGFFADDKAIIEIINATQTDILVAGLGIEKEAEFIKNNLSSLNINTIWCVGGLFDFLSGEKKRAPVFIRKIRFEWFWRFIVEPKQKFFRVFIVTIWFIYHTFVLLLKRGK